MRRYPGLLLLLILVFLVAPARAEIAVVDPDAEPEVTLRPADAQKLARLQQVVFPALASDVSPDDRSILVSASRGQTGGLAFVDITDGAVKPVGREALRWEPFTEVAWRDDHTAVYISGDDRLGAVLVSLDRDTGAVITKTLALPGFPVTLAPNASRVVVAIVPEEIRRKSRSALPPSPFTVEVKGSPFRRAGPARFDSDKPLVKLTDDEVVLGSIDLNSGEGVELVTLPQGSGLASQPAWTPDGSKLALVRTQIPINDRNGTILSDLTTQDGLGLLPPEENPFLQGNVVDAFDFARREYRLEALQAAGGDGSVFTRAGWSTDGKTLMTQVVQPARLIGRRYPIYQQVERSALRFYDASFKLQRTLDRPEIEAPTASFPLFVSPDEVIVDAVFGLSFQLFYFNRVSGEFRRISAPEGTYYQVRATRRSRQLIYNYSSFQNPYEVYRAGWDGGGRQALTALNAEAARANQIRVDQVSFTLRNGARRTGYLLQPADAPFPPRNTPLIAWQQGGPGGAITNEWGSLVEQPFNLLPNFGLALLVLPLPGREGYGPRFLNDLANGRNFGAIDIDEGAEVVRQMIARGYTARDRVGVTGCSYGGYFASQSITRHPYVYAAANSQCSLLDLFNEWQFGFTGFLSYLEGRAPTADPEEYKRDSPVYNAVRVRTPLLLFAGTRDYLPPATSANFHDQIAAGKHPVDLLLFEGEGHGLSEPSSQFAAGEAQLNWFRQYLAGGGR